MSKLWIWNGIKWNNIKLLYINSNYNNNKIIYYYYIFKILYINSTAKEKERNTNGIHM